MMHPDRQDELAAQLHREHSEGMADDRLERERREFRWDFEGWTSDDQLIMHVAGMGTLRIPEADVVMLAHSLLGEWQLFHDGAGTDDTGGIPDERRFCIPCGRLTWPNHPSEPFCATCGEDY